MQEKLLNIIETSPLHQVNLGGQNIQDSDLEEILLKIQEIRPDIEEIFLFGNELNDKGGLLLQQYGNKLDKLSRIDVQGNNIGEAGILAMCTLLQKKPHLKLALHGNQIRDVRRMEEIEKQALNKKTHNKK